VVVGQAIVAAVAPRDRMGEAMGKLQTSMTLGFLVGPVVGQEFAKLIGPRPTFLLQAVFAVVGAAIVWLAVKERFERCPDPEPVSFVKGITRDLRPLVGHRQLQMLWVMVFVIFFGFSSMWPIIVYFVQHLGVPMPDVPRYAALIMVATGSLMTAMAPIFGFLGDKIGHRRVLIGTTGACGAVLILHYLITTYAQFFVMRMLATAPGAGIHPSTSALLARTMPRARYGGAYGVLASARALAGSVGPIVGGTLAAFVGIRWVVGWTGALTILASVWAAAVVREPAADEQHRPDQGCR
jgi:DHA1 family multidrug resistance protein-like MFS transporter